MKRLNVGWDVDGVLYEFVLDLRDWISQSTGRPIEEMPYAEEWDFAIHQWGYTPDEFLELFAAGINAGFIFLNREPEPGAKEAMERIREAGHEIHIITSRLIPGAEEAAVANTEEWMRTHEIPYDSLIITKNKCCIPTDLFIEDNIDNYKALDESGCRPWLINRPWNAGYPARRVDTLEEFAHEVEMRASFLSVL